MLATLTRSQRRAASRDEARANPVPLRPRSYGQVAEIVHARHPLPHRIVTPKSGKLRGNTKRTNRAAFWAEERRTVRVHVSTELLPTFRAHLPLLGARARIHAVSPDRPAYDTDFDVHWLDLDVHVPGAPAKAVRAIPSFRVQHSDGHRIPVLAGVDWLDADGKTL